MKSKAHIGGHPLHPILVTFPIGLLIGTFILDLVSLCTGNPNYAQAAVYTETGGVISAVLAAIPGIIDYCYTVPPESSAKKRAGKHGLINSVMLITFLMCLLLRLKNELDFIYIVLIEGAGSVLLGIAGWLGGTLVTRNQISIEHRYANAGKWREETIDSNNGVVELKELDSLKLNQMRLLRVKDKRIVLARTENGLVAFDDRCMHRGASLADGVLICGTVQCPWHGSQFDVANGTIKAGPAKESIKTYRLTQENNRVTLHL